MLVIYLLFRLSTLVLKWQPRFYPFLKRTSVGGCRGRTESKKSGGESPGTLAWRRTSPNGSSSTSSRPGTWLRPKSETKQRNSPEKRLSRPVKAGSRNTSNVIEALATNWTTFCSWKGPKRKNDRFANDIYWVLIESHVKFIINSRNMKKQISLQVLCVVLVMGLASCSWVRTLENNEQLTSDL